MKKDTLLLNQLKRFLVVLLVFLIPTQLAYHFWPHSSFVFGIRIDYLSPSVYLTDLIIIFLLSDLLIHRGKGLFALIKKNKTPVLFALGFIFINIAFSVNQSISVFRWLKVLEVVGLFVYLRFEGKEINKDLVYNSLFYSLVFFSSIGILQFFLGRTLGGPLYFLGERSFNISTPGIALAQIGDWEFMRAYSTFSHPNSLSGYLGLSFLFLLSVNYFKKNPVHFVGFLIITGCLLLTFSFSAFLSLALVLLLVLVNGKKSLTLNFRNSLLFIFIGFSLFFAVFANQVTSSITNLNSSITERIDLSSVSGKIIQEKFLTGVGLGNFIISLPRYAGSAANTWLLQPVHNIFLLAFSEMGIVGFLALYLIFYRGIKKKYFLLFIFVMITGVLDHYWLTLQQNILLLTILLGLTI